MGWKRFGTSIALLCVTVHITVLLVWVLIPPVGLLILIILILIHFFLPGNNLRHLHTHTQQHYSLENICDFS